MVLFGFLAFIQTHLFRQQKPASTAGKDASLIVNSATTDTICILVLDRHISIFEILFNA